jgi:hypothetical protein
MLLTIQQNIIDEEAANVFYIDTLSLVIMASQSNVADF